MLIFSHVIVFVQFRHDFRPASNESQIRLLEFSEVSAEIIEVHAQFVFVSFYLKRQTHVLFKIGRYACRFDLESTLLTYVTTLKC